MSDSRARRFGSGAVSLRRLAARGTIVNSAFLTGLSLLAMSRGVIMAGFLDPSDYGIWAFLFTMVITLLALRQIGIADKFVQQDADDQQAEFQHAFTLELATATAFALIGIGLITGAAALYDIPELVAPGLVMTLTLPLQAFGIALAVFYRRMDFMRQRLLQAVEPVVAFFVTIGLAIAGAGYWSLVIGSVAGAAVAALVAFVASPYRFALRIDRAKLGTYFRFSWPVFVAGLTTVVVGQGLLAAANAVVGLAGIGIIALCAQVSQFADRADRAITDTIYPALCAVKDRRDLLFESFVKSNRLVLMWSLPFGAAVALFAEDLLVDVLDPKWAPGVDLLRATAVSLALHQIGFNWTAFYRAQGNTRPLAAAGLVGIATFAIVTVPLLLAFELTGLAIGVLVSEAVFLATRAFFLRRLFGPDFSFAGHAGRAVLPTLPGVAAVLALRLVEPADRGLALAAGELVVFCAVTALVTWRFEGPLMRELAGYLRRRGAVAAPA